MRTIKQISLVVLLMVSASISLIAQEKLFLLTLNGSVTDAQTGEPLVGAGVEIFVDSVKYVGLSTRAGGRFDFRGAHLSKAMMRVRLKGYQTQEFVVNQQNNGPYRIALKREQK